MHLLTFDNLHQYWSGSLLEANVLIGMNMLGALLLGMLVGYERAYHGRAAGMRTYGLVCMASCALTVFVGYSKFWYGGVPYMSVPDPTRVVQGIVSGIGFLCAGVIMKDGFSISGLTTAASIWASSAIGVLLGVGFYGAALFLALLCAGSMSLLHRLESWLPTRNTLALTLSFRKGFKPRADVLARVAQERGYRISQDSISITFENERPVWKFNATSLQPGEAVSPSELAEELVHFEGVEDFTILPARN